VGTIFQANVSASWTVTGLTVENNSASSQKFSSGTEPSISAVHEGTYSFPTFGTWVVRANGRHWSENSGVSLRSNKTRNYSCELFVDCEDCYDPLPDDGNETYCELFPCKNGDEPVNIINPCPPECTSPILIDLGRDGFYFGGPENPVLFDLLGIGMGLNIHWVKPNENDAFLVRDVNFNGIVDDGSELFGNGTPLFLSGRRHAPNGFVALAQFDEAELGGDGDGFISNGDELWRDLYLWLDSNADGVSSLHEMFPIEKSGLVRLEIIPRMKDSYDASENWLRYWARAYHDRGDLITGFDMVDVFFKQVE
jgi:hypothetical protein